MANTGMQHRAEKWIRDTWLPGEFKQPFQKIQLRLTSGGHFEFDAVSADRRTIGTVSTGKAVTRGGKQGAGKMNKIRSDILFLSLRKARRRLVILTERDMHAKCVRQQELGRLPKWAKMTLVRLPPDIAKSLRRARRKASREVSPTKRRKRLS